MRIPARPARGFTLIELLVALLVFGVFSALAYAGIGRLLDGRARLDEQQRVWQQLAQVFLRISDDVAHARPRAVRDEAGVALLPAFVGRPYDSRALAEPSLELTRGGELKYGVTAESDLRRVAWRLKDGKLYRITWPVLDRAPTTKPLEAPLIGDVESFEVRFADNTGNSVNTWPAGGVNPNTPPPAIQVTLAVKGVGSFKRLFLVNR
ncbi:MAG TPA: type II secretion system minor pseudopilin GspJ [Burkholderiales bacterium]|nr:type II secretion system minor pseudopilin GspJ [Burkholderiales bacterium]